MATRDRWIFFLASRIAILIAAIIGWDKASISFKIAAIEVSPEVLMDSCRSVGFKCYAANLLPQTAAAKGGIQRSAQILELQMALFHFVGNKITEIPLWHRYFLSSKHQNHKLPMFISKVPPRFLLPICPVKNFHPPNPQNLWGPLTSQWCSQFGGEQAPQGACARHGCGLITLKPATSWDIQTMFTRWCLFFLTFSFFLKLSARKLGKMINNLTNVFFQMGWNSRNH